MRNIRRTLAVTALQWYKNMHRSQFWLVIILVPLLAYRYMRPVVSFTRATGINATPVGIAFFFSDYSFSMILCLGLLLLFSQAPFMDEQMTHVLLRCDNLQWYIGSVLYCVMLSSFYVAYWCLCLLLPIIGNIDWSMEWGKIWSSLCQTTAFYEYGMTIKMPYVLLAYSGCQAFALSIVLKLLYSAMIACIVFTWNIPWRIPIGSLSAILLMLEDYFAINGHGYAFYWYSPSTMSRLAMLDNTDTFLQPCAKEAILLMSLVFALLVLVGSTAISHTDINKRTQL